MPDKKANYILRCFEYVTRLGGPEAAKAKLLAQPGREAKIAFLQSFPGVGPKYARNIMMDVYHEDFRDSIALDARIKAISKMLGLSFASYAEHEKFYLDVAREAGLNGWELDRLLFNYRPEVEARLGVSPKEPGRIIGSAAERTPMTVVVERSPEMVRLVYFLHEYARVGPDGRSLPPFEFGDATWREAYKQFFSRLGAGRSFKTFLGSAEGLRKGNISDHKDAGIAFLPKYDAILRTWADLSREQQWALLQQYREV